MKNIKTEVIIITILWTSIILSFLLKRDYDIFFLFGIVGLTITTLTFKKFYNFSFGLLLILLFFSIFNVITFNYAFGVTFKIKLFHITFNILSLIWFSILFFKKFDTIYKLKNEWFTDENENRSENKILFFKKEFKNLSHIELERKLNDGKLVEEAKIAIIELLDTSKIDN